MLFIEFNQCASGGENSGVSNRQVSIPTLNVFGQRIGAELV